MFQPHTTVSFNNAVPVKVPRALTMPRVEDAYERAAASLLTEEPDVRLEDCRARLIDGIRRELVHEPQR